MRGSSLINRLIRTIPICAAIGLMATLNACKSAQGLDVNSFSSYTFQIASLEIDDKAQVDEPIKIDAEVIGVECSPLLELFDIKKGPEGETIVTYKAGLTLSDAKHHSFAPQACSQVGTLSASYIAKEPGIYRFDFISVDEKGSLVKPPGSKQVEVKP